MLTKASPLIFVLLAVCALCHLRGTPTTDYNIEESKRYATLSAVAFYPKKCVDEWNCKTGSDIPMKHTFYIESPLTKAAGYVGYNSATNEIMLVFRGTVNKRNWEEDFNVEELEYSHCKNCLIHAGFLTDYRLMERTLNHKVAELVKFYPTASIVATGHSLGAAIAHVCALQLRAIYPYKQVVLHNFGQPRVGNQKLAIFASQTIEKLFRVVHNQDLIPHIPISTVVTSYHHAARQVFFNAEMTEYVVCDRSGEDPGCSNKFEHFQRHDHGFYFLNVSRASY